LGLTYQQYIPCVETDRLNPTQSASFSVSAEKYGEFLCGLFDLWMNDFKDNQPTTSIRLFESIFYRYLGLIPPECTLLEECGIYVVIEHNGDVFSCDFFVEPEWKLGNVMNGNLHEFLNSPRQKEFGKKKSSLPEPCVACEWLAYCRGGCTKDRIRDPRDNNLSHFCEAYKMFYAHAHERMTVLAENWIQNQSLASTQDFLDNAVNKTKHKVGRNDPCPCGSGKKYKKCCGS